MPAGTAGAAKAKATRTARVAKKPGTTAAVAKKPGTTAAVAKKPGTTARVATDTLPQVERPISDPPRSNRRRKRLARDYRLMGVALLAGPANVIMELSWPGVGHGVSESRVESGRVDRHPVKRARTTFTYIAVANYGTDAQKEAFRRAVNHAHSQVRSRAEDEVSYNAFDPELQLWVAACIYKGGIDIYRTFVGELDDEEADRLYRDGMSLGTTLQVPAEMWPADRAAFDKYWEESLDKVHIDDAVRKFLYPIASVAFLGRRLPGPLRQLTEGTALLITTGFLPQRFRDEMRLPWDAGKQRRFDGLIGLIGAANGLLPKVAREFPFNLMLWDLDRRIRGNLPLV
ncbi:oxygenase MpaB family protein [Mycobacterium sp.]|uniref:oxygenase MpaB family protein n=1 Tax=Mycobacterium sp. TaxID=1785 RepID=UPI003A884C46